MNGLERFVALVVDMSDRWTTEQRVEAERLGHEVRATEAAQRSAQRSTDRRCS